MKLGQLITEARSEVDDKVEPYLWTDDDWKAYFNDTEGDACSRAHLLIDSVTPEICEIQIAAGTGLYALHSKVVAIRRVKLSGQTKSLTQKTRDELDADVYDWENRNGTPEVFISEGPGELLLVPKPIVVDTVHLTVARLPLGEMTDLDNDSPEIQEQYHRGLIAGAVSRAYLKNDEDTLNLKKSQLYEAKFTVKFGPPVSAKAEQMRRRTPRNGAVRWRPFGF
jgi:hypothetical protein